MRGSGFQIDTSRFAKKLALAKEKLRAEIFWPDLLEFVRVTLNRCVTATPARDYQTIRANQSKQYDARINYIPSVHAATGDRLIVNQSGEHWVCVDNKWWNATAWRLPGAVWAVYQTLVAERERRMQTKRQAFIAGRAQARFLYKKSWVQVGESIGLDVRSPVSVQKSLTRRQPAKAPPRGFAQKRGGKQVISVAIRNPFAEAETACWNGSGAEILCNAMEKGRQQFMRNVERTLKRALFSIFKKYG